MSRSPTSSRSPARRLRAALATCVAALFAAPAFAGDHVRVILDVSGSMRNNDSGQIALLATALLHDLAQPNPTRGDSFEVIPFDQSWAWLDPSDPPPRSTRQALTSAFEQRDRFVRELFALSYTAQQTHYYPGLRRAIDDLAGLAAGNQDVRVVVLVTDGLPERFREAERALIVDQLLPVIEQHRLRLYVLAFGPEAHRHRDFFDPLVTGPTGADLGAIFVDPDGSRLLEHMLAIFGRSFGYAPDAARALPVATLELGRDTPQRVAVVVATPRPQPPTRLQLAAPPGGGTNAGPLQTTPAPGGSYALRWVLAPDAGAYRLDTDVLRGTVAVVRPTKLELEVRPAPPAQQAARVIAGRPFPVHLLVRPATGAGADPGPVTVQFREHGERTLEPRPDRTTGYEWSEDWKAPVSSAGTVTPDGRVFELRTAFPENRERAGALYVGHLEVEVSRREALVATLSGLTAHRVEVHPPLALTPRPLEQTARTALGRHETACASFRLDLNGHLPHPDRPRYAARAALELADPALLDDELRQASFTLDDRPLEVVGRPSSNPGEWYQGRELSVEELLGDHEICLTTGKPRSGDPAASLPLLVRFTLLEAPYDDLQVVEPFTFRARIAPPTVLERWGPAILGLALALSLLMMLWHLRDHATLPDDLGYAIGREGDALTHRPFPAPSPWARLFAHTGERPAALPGEDAPLGWLRPAGRELFQVRLPRGYEIEPLEPGDPPIDRRRRATLAIRRTYRIRGPRGRYLMRLEYR